MPKKHALIAGRINCTCIFYFLHLFCYSTWKCWPAYKASRENPTHSPTPCEILHFSTGDWGPKLAYTKRNPYIFTCVPFWSFSVTTSPKFLRVGFRCCVYSAASSVVKCNGSALSGGTVELDLISQFALQFYVCFTDEEILKLYFRWHFGDTRDKWFCKERCELQMRRENTECERNQWAPWSASWPALSSSFFYTKLRDPKPIATMNQNYASSKSGKKSQLKDITRNIKRNISNPKPLVHQKSTKNTLP